MKNKIFRQTLCTIFSISLLLFCSDGFAENIDPDDVGSQYAYGENVGWINLEPGGHGGPGVDVGDSALTGYMWGENIGWINLSPTNGGVDNDGAGNLSGSAWGENVGWINFSPVSGGVTIDPITGLFDGSAWGENIGWINFAPNGIPVITSWRDTDGDGIGDNTDTDDDGDGVLDDDDAFPSDSAEWEDTDGDGTGDNADPDDDGDSVLDADDAFPLDASESVDTDNDGTGDNSDNCPDVANVDQTDNDGDEKGDLCDTCPADSQDQCDPDGSTAEEFSAGEGGTVETPDGNVKIVINPGVPKDTTVSITKSIPEDPQVDILIGTEPGLGEALAVYVLEAGGVVFNSTITLRADVTHLNRTQREQVGLYMWDEVEKAFVPVEGAVCTVAEDPPGTFIKTCTAEVHHFSIYAMVASLLGGKSIKGDAVSGLLALLPTGGNKTDKRIKKALKHLEKSLDPKLWETDSTLTKKGKKVFDEEKKTVKDLQKLIKDKKVPDDVKDVCKEVIDKLVTADKLLVETALNAAKAYEGTDKKVDKEIEKSEKELAKATKKLEKGKPDKAIDHYKKAWEHAQKAIGNLSKSDDDSDSDSDDDDEDDDDKKKKKNKHDD